MKAKFLYFVTFFHQNENYNSFFPFGVFVFGTNHAKAKSKIATFSQQLSMSKDKIFFYYQFLKKQLYSRITDHELLVSYKYSNIKRNEPSHFLAI